MTPVKAIRLGERGFIKNKTNKHSIYLDVYGIDRRHNARLGYSLVFSVFSNKQEFFTTNQCEKCPSSIQRQNWNPRPFDMSCQP